MTELKLNVFYVLIIVRLQRVKQVILRVQEKIMEELLNWRPMELFPAMPWIPIEKEASVPFLSRNQYPVHWLITVQYALWLLSEL